MILHLNLAGNEYMSCLTIYYKLKQTFSSKSKLTGPMLQHTL